MQKFGTVGKRVLIFGGTGSLGTALIRRLAPQNELIVYSRDEAKHWNIRNEYGAKHPSLKFAVGDIRDRARVEEVILRYKPHFVIIASALKQVDTCELSPFESIQTNILGIKHVIDSIDFNMPTLKGSLETVMLVSTDKACAPVNVYGMCKAISERVVTSKSIDHQSPKFVAVRYGNVLDSRGSILPLFRHQGEKGEAFTLTHPDMTRFLMTLDDSIDLILTTADQGKSGETWLPKLKAMKIHDLADIFSEIYKKPVKIVGMRPGEKIHEALISESESVRVRQQEAHYVMKASFEEPARDARLFSYTSADDVMTKAQLKAYLTEGGFLNKPLDQFVGGAKVDELRTI